LHHRSIHSDSAVFNSMKRLLIIPLLCSLALAQGIGGKAGTGGKAGIGGGVASASISSVVYSTYAAAFGTSSGATTGITTTGATLLVCGTGLGSTGTAPTVTDSKSNTWNALTAYQFTGSGFAQIYYAYSHSGGALATGSGHTFTFSWTGSTRGAIACAAYSGSLTTSSVFVSGTDKGNSSSGTTVQPGALTAAQSGNLLFTVLSGNGVGSTGISIDHATSGFTVQASTTSQWNAGIADYINPPLTSLNPTWTDLGDSDIAAAVAEFSR
jgi:hypothetical protein